MVAPLFISLRSAHGAHCARKQCIDGAYDNFVPSAREEDHDANPLRLRRASAQYALPSAAQVTTAKG